MKSQNENKHTRFENMTVFKINTLTQIRTMNSQHFFRANQIAELFAWPREQNESLNFTANEFAYKSENMAIFSNNTSELTRSILHI